MKKIVIGIIGLAIVCAFTFTDRRGETANRASTNGSRGAEGLVGKHISERSTGDVAVAGGGHRSSSRKEPEGNLSVGEVQSLAHRALSGSSPSNPLPNGELGENRGTNGTLRAPSVSVASGAGNRVSRQYERFFEKYQLAGDDRQRIADILTDEAAILKDIALESSHAGLTSAQREKLFKETQNATESQIGTVLGANNASEILEYRRTLPYRPLAEKVAQRCAADGVPLPAATVDALAKVLMECPVVVGYNGEAVSPDTYKIITGRDSVAVSSAQKLLTSKQLSVLQTSLAERVAVK